MREAQITCLCLSIRIADLDIVLRKGRTVYVDEERARASEDLELARKNKGVLVRYVERCKERREPDPPAPVRPKPIIVAQKAPPTPTSVPSLDVGALADQLRDRLGGFTGSPNTEQTRQMIREEVASAFGPVLESLMGALQGAPLRPDVGKVEEWADAPVFIPSKIVGDDTQADISVDRDEADSGSVDAAAKALKAAKKAKRDEQKRR